MRKRKINEKGIPNESEGIEKAVTNYRCIQKFLDGSEIIEQRVWKRRKGGLWRPMR